MYEFLLIASPLKFRMGRRRRYVHGRHAATAVGGNLIRSRKAPRCTTSVGRTAAWGQCRKAASRGKSGLHGHAVPDNVRRGQPQGQCHRNQTARRSPQGRRRVRVKRCGKSAPRFRQRKRHGKPHREQDRIGAARVCFAQAKLVPDRMSAIGRPGRLLEAPGNRRHRGMVVTRRIRRLTEPGLQAG